MRYGILALLLFVAVTPAEHRVFAPSPTAAPAFQTDEFASDSLWAYRNRFAQSATNMAVRMKAVLPAAANETSKEYSYLDKVNDTLLEAALLLTWTSDIMRMQGEMCEPARSQYDAVVLDRLQRTRDTLATLQPILHDHVQSSDREISKEVLARNDDMQAAQQALDSIIDRWDAAENQ